VIKNKVSNLSLASEIDFQSLSMKFLENTLGYFLGRSTINNENFESFKFCWCLEIFEFPCLMK